MWCPPIFKAGTSAFRELAAVSTDGIQKAEELVTGLSRPNVNYGRMQPLIGELARVDDAIRVAGRTRQMLLPLTSLFSFEKENLEGDDPKLLAQDTLRLYTDMLDRCQLIQRKIGTLAGILAE